MKIHLRQIPAEGLHLEGEEVFPIAELEADRIRCLGPLRYKIDIGVSGHSLWANGSLALPAELQCVSCLEKFAHEITVPAFAVHTELKGPETIDLAPFIREDILLNLPAYPHCDREGGRKCAHPMLELTAAETEDREAKREHDWEALDQLKLRK